MTSVGKNKILTDVIPSPEEFYIRAHQKESEKRWEKCSALLGKHTD